MRTVLLLSLAACSVTDPVYNNANDPYRPRIFDKGDRGDKGDIGPMGPMGPQGFDGVDGLKGEKGDIGPAGPQGLQGERGPVGPQGIIGPVGPQGLTGPQGLQGLKGDTGAAGPQGLKGDTGPVGATGPRGEKGDWGGFFNGKSVYRTSAEMPASPDYKQQYSKYQYAEQCDTQSLFVSVPNLTENIWDSAYVKVFIKSAGSDWSENTLTLPVVYYWERYDLPSYVWTSGSTSYTLYIQSYSYDVQDSYINCGTKGITKCRGYNASKPNPAICVNNFCEHQSLNTIVQDPVTGKAIKTALKATPADGGINISVVDLNGGNNKCVGKMKIDIKVVVIE